MFKENDIVILLDTGEYCRVRRKITARPDTYSLRTADNEIRIRHETSLTRPIMVTRL